MNITPGPLPNDYDRVDASVFLEDFVNNTKITGFAQAQFDTNFTFVTSQTDQPTPSRGALWFKRGEGVLYLADMPDRGSSVYTATTFLGIGPRRDLLVEIAHSAQPLSGLFNLTPGMIVGPRFPPTATVLFQYYRDTNSRQTIKADPYIGNLARPMHTAWVSLDTPVSGYPLRVVEWGFCPVAMASGFTAVAGKPLRASTTTSLNDGANPIGYYWHCRYGTWSGETLAWNFGVVTLTTGATAAHMNVAWKRPTCDFYWDT